MSHNWTKGVCSREIDAILSATGQVSRSMQVAKAFLHVIKMAGEEDRVEITAEILRKYDPTKPNKGGMYDFPAPWTAEKWQKECLKSFDALEQIVTDIREKCGDSANKVAVQILKSIDAMEVSEQILFFTLVLHTNGWCPMNYLNGEVEVGVDEWKKISERKNVQAAIEKLSEFFSGELRFRNSAAEGSFLYDLIKNRPPEEAIVILGAYSNGFKAGYGFAPGLRVVGVGIVKESNRHDPDCTCKNCINTRTARSN